jgi:hypothetical protein
MDGVVWRLARAARAALGLALGLVFRHIDDLRTVWHELRDDLRTVTRGTPN